MDKLSLENIATNVSAYTVGGVPLITYVFLAVSAILVGTMFQEEKELEEELEDEKTVVKEDILPFVKEEVEVEEEDYGKEEKRGGGKKGPRKTKKKKPKRKRKHSKKSLT